MYCLLAGWVLAAASHAGTGLDTDFGERGLFTLGDASSRGWNWFALPDGSLLTTENAGLAANGPRISLGLRRLDANGRPLASWGAGGATELSIGPIDRAVDGVFNATIRGAARDGRILIGVVARVSPPYTTGSELFVTALARPDGGLDHNFGRGGLLDAPGYGRLMDLATLHPDGSIYATEMDVIGDLYPYPVKVKRYGGDGRIDPAFVDRAPRDDVSDLLSSSPWPLPDGRLLLVTQSSLVRLENDGSLDVSFGRNGRIDLKELLAPLLRPTRPVQSMRVRAATLRGDGRLLLVYNDEQQLPADDVYLWGLAMLDVDGRLVQTFGTDGTGVARFRAGPVTLDERRVTSWDGFVSIRSRPGGEIFASIEVGAGSAPGERGAYINAGVLMRWSPDGRLLEGFESAAPGWLSLGSLDLVDVQPGDRPVLALGSANLVRLGSAPGSNPGILTTDAIAWSADESSGLVTIPVLRSGGTHGAVSVRYANVVAPLNLPSGTGRLATSGLDFEPFEGRLEWADGESGVKMIRLRLRDDDLDEDMELIPVGLDDAQGGVRIAQPQLYLPIVASDKSPPATTTNTPATPANTTSAAGGGGAADPWMVAAMLSWLLASRGLSQTRRPVDLPRRDAA